MLDKIQIRKPTFIEKMRKNYDSKAVDMTIRKLLVAVNKSSNQDALRVKAYNILLELVEMRKQKQMQET